MGNQKAIELARTKERDPGSRAESGRSTMPLRREYDVIELQGLDRSGKIQFL